MPSAPTGSRMWNLRVSRVEKERLRELLPRGAGAYFVKQALSRFLDEVRGDKERQAFVHRDIQRVTYLEEKPGIVAELITPIPSELYDEFKQLFPEFGAATWFARRVVQTIIAEIEGNPFEHYIDRAVFRLLEEGPIELAATPQPVALGLADTPSS